MTGVRIEFDVAGDKLISRELLRFSEAALDATPAFEAIGRMMIAETSEQFATEGGHASGGWKPLKEATLRAKQRRHLDPRILHATLALEKSLTSVGDENMILEASRDSLVYGSRLPYAAVHQRPRKTNRLPQRRPVEFTERAKRDMVRTLQRWIVTGSLS